MSLNQAPFPAASYQQIFPGGEQTLRPLEPADDGAHSLPGGKFFEWWYFDAHFDNGYRLATALHSALFNVISRPPVIAIHLYAPDGSKVVEVNAFKPSEAKSEVGRCDVQLGSSRAWDAGDHYVIHLEQGPIHARLEYHKQAKGIQVGTGILFEDPASGQSFHWIIPLPRARVSGWLSINGERVAVEGLGYHDHNWGNLDLCQAFRRWTWGRVLAGEYTLVFGNMIGRGDENLVVTPLALWQGAELLLCTDQFKIHSVESQIEGRTDIRYSRHIELQIDNDLQLVQANLHTEQILDIIDFAQPRSRWGKARQAAEISYFVSERLPLVNRWIKQWVGYATYLRLQASCELMVASHQQRGHALCEQMDFGAVL